MCTWKDVKNSNLTKNYRILVYAYREQYDLTIPLKSCNLLTQSFWMSVNLFTLVKFSL